MRGLEAGASIRINYVVLFLIVWLGFFIRRLLHIHVVLVLLHVSRHGVVLRLAIWSLALGEASLGDSIVHRFNWQRPTLSNHVINRSLEEL